MRFINQGDSTKPPFQEMPRLYIRANSTTIATASAKGEHRPRFAADVDEPVDEPEFPPEAAAGLVDAGSVPDDEPVLAEGLADPVEEGSDDEEPVPGTMVRGVEHLPSRVVRSAALDIAAGVDPQFVYCCMWMALVSRSKTAIVS